METLLLTPWMAPSRIVPWETAVTMVLLGKVSVLAEHDEVCRSPSVSLKIPSVIVMRRAPAPVRRTTRFSRQNVFARDGYACQYCGGRFPASHLNFDHVVPRARGGRRTWENIVAACLACNRRKGCRTPEEAGMRLLSVPRRPTHLPPAPLLSLPANPPADWRPFLPPASGRTIHP